MENIMGFLKDEDGVTMIEYALLAALIAVVCILAITGVGTNIRDKFNEIAGHLTS